MDAYMFFILGILSTCVTAQTPLQEEVIASLERIDNQVSKMESTISFVTHQSVSKIKPQISGISDTLWLSTAQASLTKVGDSLHKFKTSSTTTQISGALDILSAFAAVLPGAGPLVAGFFGFASGLVGILGNGSKKQIGVGEIVSKSIHDALSRYQDESLRSEAWGVRHEFTVSQAFLNAMINATLTETDILLMSSNVPVYRGARFFGVLEYKIVQKKTSTDQHDVNIILSYILMYCELSTSRQSVLSQLQFKIQDFSYSSTIGNAIESVIDHTKLVERNVLDFLVNPDPENLPVVSTFVPSSIPVITEFLGNRGIPALPVSTDFKWLCVDGAMPLTRNQNANTHTYLTYIPSTNNQMFLSFRPKENTLYFERRDYSFFNEFKFTHIGDMEEDNFVSIIMTQSTPLITIVFDKERMTMIGEQNDNPGDKGKWKVIELNVNGDRYLVLSPKLFPQGFVRAVNSVDGWVAKIAAGDPGTRGYMTKCRYN